MIRKQKSYGKAVQAGGMGAGAWNREAISLSGACSLFPPLPGAAHSPSGTALQAAAPLPL